MFDYLPADALLMLSDGPSVARRMSLVRDRIQANYLEAVDKQRAALPPEDLFLGVEEFEEIVGKRLSARISVLPDPEGQVETQTLACSDHGLLAQEIELQRKKRGLLAPLADRIIRWQEGKETIVLACRSLRQCEHLRELLGHYQLQDRPPARPLLHCTG